MKNKIQMNVRVTEEQKDVLSKVLDVLREDEAGNRVEDLENWLAGYGNVNAGDVEKIIAERDARINEIEERLAKLEVLIPYKKPN
ncbi:MAG: hypothetical protein NXI13_07495 [Proteobacteria bacterium]|nr:hypothetical protein [Pseudomonadota bacterium]